MQPDPTADLVRLAATNASRAKMFFTCGVPKPVLFFIRVLLDPDTLLFSMSRFFRFLPEAQKQAFLRSLSGGAA
jgi:hypothetical protein